LSRQSLSLRLLRERKSSGQKGRVRSAWIPETGKYFEKKNRSLNKKMKKVLVLSTVLGLGALGIACGGETPANKPANNANAAANKPASTPAPATNAPAAQTAPASNATNTAASNTAAKPAANDAKPANTAANAAKPEEKKDDKK
jgi:hypothetical protein